MQFGLSIEVERARAYVLAHGALRQRVRLASILDGAPPDREVARALEAMQRGDGGFAAAGSGPPGAGSVGITCDLLAELRQLPPLGGSPMASRALAFLRRSQRTDGAWAEEPGRPVQELTASAALTLLVMDPSHLDPVERAGRWLRQHRDLLAAPQLLRPLGQAAALWHRLYGPGAPEVAEAFAAVGRAAGQSPGAVAPGGHFPLTASSWLEAALEAGVGGARLAALGLLLRVVAGSQRPDGSFPGPSEPAVEPTLLALRVLHGSGLIG